MIMLSMFKIACDTNAIKEGTHFVLLPFFSGAGRCQLKLQNSAIVKVTEVPKGEEANQLK